MRILTLIFLVAVLHATVFVSSASAGILNSITVLFNKFLSILEIKPALPSSLDTTIHYQWKTVEFDFKGQTTKEDLIAQKKYNQSNIILTALKIVGNRIFVATPPYLPGVPVTFSVIPKNLLPPINNTGPLLVPYPSYDNNIQGKTNCTKTLQTVQSAEVDKFNRLWIPDTGRTNILNPDPAQQVNNCPPKLMLVNLDDDTIEYVHEFPAAVASPTAAIIKDIQVECDCNDRNSCKAYISNLAEGKITVFDLKTKTSWAVQDNATMQPNLPQSTFVINGTTTMGPFGITGLALAPGKTRNFDQIYFSRLSGLSLYKISTSDINNLNYNGTTHTLSPSDVQELIPADGKGHSDGLAMDCDSNLYFGNLTENSVRVIRTGDTIDFLRKSVQLANDPNLFSWPDTFSFDDCGNLFITTTKFQLWQIGKLSPNEYNYRIMQLDLVQNAFAYNSKKCCPGGLF